MRLLTELVLTIGGMGLTTLGLILTIETTDAWPLLFVLVGIPVLYLSVETGNAD